MYWDKILTKEFLIEELINKKKYKAVLAREISCNINTINLYINIHNIDIPYSLSTEGSEFLKYEDENFKVLEYAGNDRFGKRKFKCLCRCGNEFICNKASLVRGLTKSCGCLKKEKCRKNGYEELSGQYIRRIKKQAKERGIFFDLELKDIWEVYLKQDKKCALTGLDLQFTPDYNKPENQNASVDRIDSNKGYTKDNIQIVHKIVNLCKNYLQDDEFIAICYLITSKHGKELKYEDCKEKLLRKTIHQKI